MAKRDRMTPEQRARENELNRERMARAREAMTPEERSAEAACRKERERKKAESDPEWAELKRLRRSRTLRRYFDSRRDDPNFTANRTEYLRRWRAERRVDEEFEAFMARIEREVADAD